MLDTELETSVCGPRDKHTGALHELWDSALGTVWVPCGCRVGIVTTDARGVVRGSFARAPLSAD